ncbi:Na/Pi cotransporter family protein [Sulfurovum sp. CS9]|uniref:Na/Pi cotransporter family protein n=1 Tax=Sulfurovum sp. CS9 TaxID=3391146 RepID=UPI0039E9C8D1
MVAAPSLNNMLKHQMIALFLLSSIFISYLYATKETLPPSVDWFESGMGLFGGLALFLAGLDQLTEGLKMAAGDALKNILQKLTTNRVMGVITGTLVTGLLNSSSVTTVLVIGFVTVEIMTLQQSVAVIMGANIGSTVTAQLLAFNITKFALLPVAIGFFMTFTSKQDKIRYYGMMLMGIGMVFFGMGVMSEAMAPMRTYEPFIDFLEQMKNPILGILAGAAFTGIVQSSAATVGISIALASEGLLSLPAGIALALGANIGTCVTALLASLGKPVEAVRTSIVHVLFNVIGVLIWLPFIAYLSDIAVAISPVAEGLEGMEKMAYEVPRQIANGNTFFNIANVFLFILITPLFAKAATKLVPEKVEKKEVMITPKYLNEDALAMPSTAFDNVRFESARSIELIKDMVSILQIASKERYNPPMDKLQTLYQNVRILENANLLYLGKIRQLELTERDSLVHQNLMSTNTMLEGIAYTLQTEIREIVKKAVEIDYKPSQTTQDYIRQVVNTTLHALALTEKGLKEHDYASFEEILEMKKPYKELLNKFMQRKSERLAEARESYLDVVKIETTLVNTFYHIYHLNRLLAKQWIKEQKLLEEEKL